MSKLGIRTSLICIGAMMALAVGAEAQQQFQRPPPLATPSIAEITPQSRAEIARRVLGISAPITNTASVTPMAPSFNNGALEMTAVNTEGGFSWRANSISWSGVAYVELRFRVVARARYLVICDVTGQRPWQARINPTGASHLGPGSQPLSITFESGRAIMLVTAQDTERAVSVGLTVPVVPNTGTQWAAVRRCEVSQIG